MRTFREITNIILIIFLISLHSCTQNANLDDRIDYVNNPKSTDTLCISEIQRAQEDIKNGKIVFTQKFGFGTSQLRYENELIDLCKENGLVFDVDLIECSVYEGQTRGCYGDYMDKMINEKFGIDFKDKLHKKADSLYLENVIKQNKIVRNWDCDEKARLPNETERNNDYLPSIKVKDLDIKEKIGDYGGWPFFDFSFIVEKDSSLSGFYISNFVPQLDDNKKYEKELFNLAVGYMKTNYPIWIPGKISGIPVRTDKNVRLFFVKE